MLDHFNQCCLCLKMFEPNEARKFIDESIRTDYKCLTQDELIDSTTSTVVCDWCSSSLRMANRVKMQLSANNIKFANSSSSNSSTQQFSLNDGSDDIDKDPKIMIENMKLRKEMTIGKMKSVPGFKRSAFKCFYCDKTYAQRCRRKHHIQVEHMKQSFTCIVDGCEVVYKNKDILKRHVTREHHNLENYEDICNATFQLAPTFGVLDLKLDD